MTLKGLTKDVAQLGECSGRQEAVGLLPGHPINPGVVVHSGNLSTRKMRHPRLHAESKASLGYMTVEKQKGLCWLVP